MAEGPGLRERKKVRTREAISNAATALFLERGFDNVSVAEIAAAIDMSKMTVFNYFPTKEDLVMHQIADHVDEATEIVRHRAPGESPVAALRRSFLADLADRNPTTGLSNDERFFAFQRMIMSTPSLKLRLADQWLRAGTSLATTFAELLDEEPEAITPRVAASQVIAVHQELVQYNFEQVLAGRDLDDIYPEAVAVANQAFDLLEHGLAGSALGSDKP
jgi:AcrR family transcriptional regulator